MQLANTLAYSLTADTSMQVRLLACRVLTNLAATEQRDGDDDVSYYGRQPEGAVLLGWAVGNLAGDSQPARDAARHAGVVQPLVTILCKGMELKHTAICRNAAWAFSNLTRGITTSGQDFCGPFSLRRL